nr:MAG TPA: hypothetical protein [Caudoviricetes sp.]
MMLKVYLQKDIVIAIGSAIIALFLAYIYP